MMFKRVLLYSTSHTGTATSVEETDSFFNSVDKVIDIGLDCKC